MKNPMQSPQRRLSVRAHLFLLVLSVYLPAVGIFTWHVVQELQAARKDAYDSVKQLADETAANLRAILDNNEVVLGRLAARPLIRALDTNNCDPILRDYVSLHPEVSTLALRDARANIICTLLADPPSAEQARQFAWFQEALSNGRFTVGDASLNPRGGRWVSISAFPVRDGKENVSGFVFFSLDLLKLNQQIFRFIPKNAAVAVIDRRDNYLLRTIDPEKSIGRPFPAENSARVRGQQEGYFSRSGADGVRRLVAFVTVPGTGWRVFAGLPEEEVLAASRARLGASIAIGFALLLLTLALAYWIGSKIVNPVRLLARTAARITRGDSAVRAPVAGPAEVAAVALRFNQMLDVRERSEAARAGLEAQLRESQKMEAIGTLAGGIAHDFNNALATILGNAELARQDMSANPLALESLEEIRKAGLRARDLVQQILAFSRRQPAARKLTALANIVEESARLLRATLPARLALDVHCDTDVPPVLADATQIQQVLINLVTNAMQAMTGGPGHIGIRLDTAMLDAALADAHPALRALHEQHPGRTVRLAVSDDGPGMDAATLARIFEPFFTTKPVGEGTGLGLSIVHGIVQGHEGAMVVDSHPGKGSTFTLYLPAAAAQAGAPVPDHSFASTVPVPNPDAGRHILYLDDDESLVFLVQRLLERRGLRVSGYTDQMQALDALRADPSRFDLVVTDYNMPGISGLEVAREVRTIHAAPPVAMASGFIDEELRAQAGAAGVRELIFKASTADKLCDAFARLAQEVGTASKSS